LSREEAQKSMPQLARDFDRIDANKDGMVTPEELEAALKARRGASKGKGV
jgi:Ca2+-binding EF-hand superfamily protein